MRFKCTQAKSATDKKYTERCMTVGKAKKEGIEKFFPIKNEFGVGIKSYLGDATRISPRCFTARDVIVIPV